MKTKVISKKQIITTNILAISGAYTQYFYQQNFQCNYLPKKSAKIIS